MVLDLVILVLCSAHTITQIQKLVFLRFNVSFFCFIGKCMHPKLFMINDLGITNYSPNYTSLHLFRVSNKVLYLDIPIENPNTTTLSVLEYTKKKRRN